MSTEPVCSSSSKALGGPKCSDDKLQLVVPRVLGTSDELVAYSYRILDQCLTLCDAVEEVKRTISGSVPPYTTADDTNQDDLEEMADTVSSWRAHVANVGMSLVQLTADIRLSSLVKQVEDNTHTNEVTETIPRSFHPKELAAIKQTLSKFGTTYETLNSLQNELTQPRSSQSSVMNSMTVADGLMQSCNSRKKVSRQSHRHSHQLQQRRRRGGSTNMMTLLGPGQKGDQQPPRNDATAESNYGGRSLSPRTTFAPLEYGTLMKTPVPPTTQAPNAVHRRAQPQQQQRQISHTFFEKTCTLNRFRSPGSDAMGHGLESGKSEGCLISRGRPVDESTDTTLKNNTLRAERPMAFQISGNDEPEAVNQRDVHFPDVKGGDNAGTLYLENKSELGSAAGTGRSSMFGSNFKSCFKDLLADRY